MVLPQKKAITRWRGRLVSGPIYESPLLGLPDDLMPNHERVEQRLNLLHSSIFCGSIKVPRASALQMYGRQGAMGTIRTDAHRAVDALLGKGRKRLAKHFLCGIPTQLWLEDLAHTG